MPPLSCRTAKYGFQINPPPKGGQQRSAHAQTRACSWARMVMTEGVGDGELARTARGTWRSFGGPLLPAKGLFMRRTVLRASTARESPMFDTMMRSRVTCTHTPRVVRCRAFPRRRRPSSLRHHGMHAAALRCNSQRRHTRHCSMRPLPHPRAHAAHAALSARPRPSLWTIAVIAVLPLQSSPLWNSGCEQRPTQQSQCNCSGARVNATRQCSPHNTADQ